MSLPPPPIRVSPALLPVRVNPSFCPSILIEDPEVCAEISLIPVTLSLFAKVCAPVDTSILLVPPPPCIVSLLA